MDAFLDRISKLSHGKLALLAAELYQRSGTADRAAEPIAITAMACRVPGGGNSPEAFWSFLERGGDAIESIPDERLAMAGASAAEMDGPGANWGGFLRGIDEFDPALFGISPKEAKSMDPQQRILLEVCWEALENVGTPIDALDSATGVFMGVSGIDYALLSRGSGRDQNSFLVTGVANAILAGRISYVFGLNGPSSVTDTACSASAAAIHLACQSLGARECDQALAGGINLLLLPQITQTISGLQSLARDGRCKAFSADADGFVRGEGCGVIVLRRLSDAVSRGEPILGAIRGSAWNQDGKSGGLTAPNGTAQEQVIRAALAAAKVSPDQVSYIEAHGTGTALGDPIEISALGRVFGGPQRQRDLPVGSVKTNIGHLEAAAGVAGLMKVVLSLQHQFIPPHLHAANRNPRVDWDSLPFVIPSTGLPWPKSAEPRIAGVSSFGLSGTNVHLVVSEPPVPAEPDPASPRSITVLTVSAKSREALVALAGRYGDVLSRRPAVDMSAFAASANLKRAHYAHRLALIVCDSAKAAAELSRFSNADASSQVQATFIVQHRPPRIGLLCGDVPPSPTVVARLREAEPAFRTAYDAWLASHPSDASRVPTPVVACVGFQYALAALWHSWGIRPALCCGEGAGEIAAALLAGGLALDDAAALAARADANADAIVPAASNRPTMKLLLGSGSEALRPGHVLAANAAIGNGLTGRSLRETARASVDHLIHLQVDHDEALLTDLAAAYLAGTSLDWRSFHASDRIDPVPLPNYPFQRSRYWPASLSQPVHQPAVAPDISDLDQQQGLYRIEWSTIERQIAGSSPSPGALIEALQPRLITMEAEQDFLDVGQVQRDLDGFALLSACAALRQLMAGISPGTPLPVELLDQMLGVVPAQGRMLRRVLAILEASGLAQRVGDSWTISDALPEADLSAEIERLRRVHPRFKVEIDLAARAVRLPDVLRGNASGVDVLFPNGSMALVDALYRDSIAARIMNRIVGETVAELSRLSSQPLRVLEIGAGTGSTTAAVLRHLPAAALYTFTDVSSAFLAPARIAFAQRGIRFEVLDIESAADVCRLATSPFDLILAANVLHATRDLRQTLGHVRSLLRPGGVLVLLEGTETFPITDITLGMLDGWWRHDDDVQRSSGPLLNREQWRKVLHQVGFEAECLPTQPSFGGVTEQQTVVVARLQPTSPSSSTISSVAVLHRDPAAAASVRAALEAAGVAVRELSLTAGARLELNPPGTTQGAWLFLPARDPDGADPVGNAETGFADLLTIAQAMLDLGGSSPNLYVATSGAQPTNLAIRAGHAALWGAARVLASEAPGAAVSLIDLDAEAPDWNALALLIASGCADPELSVTARGVMVPTLVSARLPAAAAGTAISPGASYIVTGAFGVLGAYAVRWLAEQGAGKLFLIGRHPPNAIAVAAIEAARDTGAAVETVIADIGDAQDVAAAFECIEADPKPLKGIIHAAAVLDDAQISRQTSASFSRAFAPKGKGAWLLHQYSLRHELDFFVIYSSVAALVGSAGQANYAASNAFIDALAHHRRTLGLPASSINWGLWAATGAAIRRDVVDTGTMQGAIPITPAQGQVVLARVIAGDAAQVAVMPLDRALLRRALGSRRPPTLLQPLLASADGAVTAPSGLLVADYARQLEGATGWARILLLMDFIRKRSAELLDLHPSSAIDDDRPLLDLGLDSLVGLELRNDVQTLSGLKLPSTLFFDCPTLRELRRYLQVVHPQQPPSTGKTSPATLEQVLI